MDLKRTINISHLFYRTCRHKFSSNTSPLISKHKTLKHLLFNHDYLTIRQQLNHAHNHHQQTATNIINRFRKAWLLSDNPQHNHELTSSILATNDLHIIAYYLSLINLQTTCRQQHVISPTDYSLILAKYYQLFGIVNVTTQASISKQISPSIDLQYLLPKFIYLQNPTILSLLKIQQKHLLQNLISSNRHPTLQQFMLIITPQIYNITDLPLLHQLIYKHYIPKLNAVNDIHQFKQCLKYLYTFQCIQEPLFQKIIDLVHKNYSHKASITCDQLVNIMELLVLYVTRNYQLFQSHRAKGMVMVESTLKDILAKSIEIKGQLIPFHSVLEDQTKWTYIIQAYSQIDSSLQQRVISYKEELLTICQSNQSNNVSLTLTPVQNIFKNNQSYLQQLSNSQIQESLSHLNKLKIQILLIQFLTITSTFKFIPIEIYTHILALPSNLSFIRQNMYLQYFMKNLVKFHFQKILIHHQEAIDRSEEIKVKVDEINRVYNEFRTSVTNFIEEDIVNVSNGLKQKYESNEWSQYFTYFYPLTLSQLSQNLPVIDILMHCLTQKHHIKKQPHQKIINMLKKDPLFLSSTMHYNGRQLLSNYTKDNLLFANESFHKWQYPYFYNYISADHKYFSISNHFNRNQIMAAKLVKYRSRFITNYGSLCKAIKANKQ